LLHIFVLSVVATCAVAGVWQLTRLVERRTRNDEIREALDRTETDRTDFVLAGGKGLRERVRVTGRYDTENEVILRNRSLDGSPGNHVLTPLVTRSGGAFIVDRGWVPAEFDDPPVERAAPPSGRVTVHGLMVDAEPRRPLTPDDPGSGRLESVRRINPARLDKQIPYRVHPVYIQLRSQEPASTNDLPRVVPLPELSDGPHLAYAFQWFAFIVIALAVYVILLRREAKKTPARSAGSTTG
jgi:cytochrome oxidase assembly protein ShyY1